MLLFLLLLLLSHYYYDTYYNLWALQYYRGWKAKNIIPQRPLQVGYQMCFRFYQSEPPDET